jgi:acyl dehydratase
MTVTTAEVEIGTELPVFTRVGGLPAWNRFAAVNDEFIDIHMDPARAHAMGYPDVIGMGNLQTAYLHAMLRAWLGPAGHHRILGVSCQFRSFSLPGVRTTARGTVTAVRPEGDDLICDLEVWTQDDEGTRIATGTAVVRLAGSV